MQYFQNCTTYKHQTYSRMLLMTRGFQQYQYRKDCNLCSDKTAKKCKSYNNCLPSKLLIFNCSQHLAVTQSAQSSSGNHNRLWNGGVIFREGADVAVLSKMTSSDCLYTWMVLLVQTGKKCIAIIFSTPTFANLLYIEVKSPCLCDIFYLHVKSI